MSPPSILIADDHPLVRQGIVSVIEGNGSWQVCGEATDGRAALTLAEELKPNIVLMDITMPLLNGLEAARQIRQSCPATEVLMLSMHESEQLVRASLEAGARGYLLKTDTARLLVIAIESLLQHKPFFTGTVSERVLLGFLNPGESTDPVGRDERLSGREREVVQLLVEGMTNKEAATALGISPKTVDAHRTNIMRKLEIHSVAALVRYAVRNKIIDP